MLGPGVGRSNLWLVDPCRGIAAARLASCESISSGVAVGLLPRPAWGPFLREALVRARRLHRGQEETADACQHLGEIQICTRQPGFSRVGLPEFGVPRLRRKPLAH